MTLIQNEPKKIYIRINQTYKTFTISWEEKSDMSSWWTYSDDAAWLTAWDSAFDEFFWYYGCRLSNAGVETATITQADSGWAWKLDITQLWTLTSGDNVMIAFPKRWVKMTKSWSVVTLSITDEPNAEWYQYYAFTKGTDIKDNLYLWAYKMNSYYQSLSWTSPYTSWTRSQCRTNLKSVYDSTAWTNRYSLITIYPRWYINALYMMKYGNPNSQSVVWAWYTWWSNKVNTWWTNIQANATYWTSSDTQQAKLFWLEDWWGNWNEYLDCCWTESYLTVDKTNSVFQDSAYGTSIWQPAAWWLWGIAWTNDWMFMNTYAAWNSSTYYTDYSYYRTTSIPIAWGSRMEWGSAWALCILWQLKDDYWCTSRVQYL